MNFNMGIVTKTYRRRPAILRARSRGISIQNQLTQLSQPRTLLLADLPLVNTLHIVGGTIRRLFIGDKDMLLDIMFSPLHFPFCVIVIYSKRPEIDNMPYKLEINPLPVKPTLDPNRAYQTEPPKTFSSNADDCLE